MNGATLLKCICEETRFSILELLQKNHEMSVNDLVAKLKKGQPLVSHHLRALKDCNIVKTKENGKMTMYSIANKDISRLIAEIVKTSQRMVACCEAANCC
ncbi:MAG TPA: metalloregulator ArsR/SmtB family transcription factor [Candidatus Nitrosotenuis sp.]|jgi:DNA-binding transcriptional ArsR family regulator|nr:metalloregulator ArsR/SmtB family transcription factor [Candidatus Nitrosotenuis sp.]